MRLKKLKHCGPKASGKDSPSRPHRHDASGRWATGAAQTLARVRALIRQADPRRGRGGEVAEAVERDAGGAGVGA